jgi:hypothetical protein
MLSSSRQSGIQDHTTTAFFNLVPKLLVTLIGSLGGNRVKIIVVMWLDLLDKTLPS